MTRCARGLDADMVADFLGRMTAGEPSMDTASRSAGELRDFVEHARTCAECARMTRAWELVRGAWRAETLRDERFHQGASERRLVAGWPRRTGVPWSVAVLGAAAAAALAVWIMSAREPVAGTSKAAGATALAIPTASPFGSARLGSPRAPESAGPDGVELSTPTPPISAPVARGEGRVLVAVRSCAACGEGLREGARMEADARVVVPRGARLALNWGVDESLIDAASGVDVEGPAVVRASGDSGALELERGVVRVVARSAHDVFTNVARTRGADAAWTVHVEDARTRVTVERGEVEVSTGMQRALAGAGQSFVVLPDGRLETSPVFGVRTQRAPSLEGALEAPSLDASLPAATLLSARDALRSGDRPGAADAFRSLAQSSTDRSERERASFALAEIELADGKTDDARSLLSPLLDASDPSLAGDAAFLLARSAASARDRAEVLERYVATPRPSPYREQAEAERARALVEAGDAARARAVVRALRLGGVPAVVEAGLAQVEQALAAAP